MRAEEKGEAQIRAELADGNLDGVDASPASKGVYCNVTAAGVTMAMNTLAAEECPWRLSDMAS